MENIVTAKQIPADTTAVKAMQDEMPLISVIISNYNRKDITATCVRSVLQGTIYPKERLRVLIVDDGSTDGSADFLRRRFDGQAELLALRDNVGFIKANNAAIVHALERHRPNYILLLNNDTQIVEGDWLARLAATAESYGERMGVMCPRLVFSDGRAQWSGRARERNLIALMLQTVTARHNPGFAIQDGQPRGVIPVNTVSGACMLIKSALITQIGLLDVSLAPAFQEDVEYSFRTSRAGFEVLYQPDIRVMHMERASFYGVKNQEAVKDRKYWILRNSMVVSFKYFGVFRTLAIGLPIFVVSMLDVKDKRRKLGITNVTLALNPIASLGVVWKSSRDALRIYTSKQPAPEHPASSETTTSSENDEASALS